MCIKNMRKSRILRRKMHHKGDAKIGIKLKKDYEICTNGKCQKRVRNLTKKQNVLESNAGGDKAQKTIEVASVQWLIFFLSIAWKII